MDKIFASREHQSHALRRKVERSGVYPLGNKLNAMKDQNQKKFDDVHTVGGTLLELSTNAMQDTRMQRTMK